MSSGIDKVKAIFIEALGCPSSDARAAFVDRACGDDSQLRRDVNELLHVHDTIRSADEPEPLGGTVDLTGPGQDDAEESSARSDLLQSETFGGRYRIIEILGEGGMGIVCLAQQLEPVKRKVALKVIKLGMDSRRVLTRFEAERQALAVLDHHNIAKVFDGGITDDGRPYFVMEYVKGVALTTYCDSNRLTIRERLELFLQVCHAVQHAHQKGIIHRDLKPSNILVALFDEKAVVKVIDFGLAKALHQPLTEFSQFTPHGTAVGTAMYMSPEQAVFNNLDIDTRSDIYSLGVILYELLTGTTPLEKQRYKQAAWDEVLRIIRDEEPMRPSTKISSVVELLSIAAQRRVEPLKLNRLLRGELDWIVMKALEKERNRRYDTASSLAVDIQHYLNEEPIAAGPPSASYRLRKFARKYKGTVATVALILASLIAGIIGTTWGMVRARQAERRERANHQKILQSQRQVQEAILLLDLLVASEDSQVLVNDPPLAFKDLTVRNLLLYTRDAIRTRFREFPELQAQIHAIYGKRFRALGSKEDLALAESHFQEACRLAQLHLPENSDNRLQWELELGGVWKLNDPPRAVQHLEQLLDDVCRLRSESDPLRLRVQAHAGMAHQFAGHPDQARLLLQPVLALQEQYLGRADPDTLETLRAIAWVEMNSQEYQTAYERYSEVLARQQENLPAMHSKMATTHNNFGLLHRLMYRAVPPDRRDPHLLDQAEHHYREALRIIEHSLGSDHPNHLITEVNLAVVEYSRGELESACRGLENVLPKIDLLVQAHDRTRLAAISNHAAVLLRLGKTDQAEQQFAEVFRVAQTQHEPGHPDFDLALANYVECLRRNGKTDQATSLQSQF